jgi:protein tyrosine/serine phosphatase
MESPARLLPLVGAYNFRDLGGYPTTDGRSTRWGRLFRSDTLQELTSQDLQLLREIGLASVIDLRTANEIERTGRGVLRSEPVKYVNFSVLPDAGGERQAATALVESFGVIADPDSYPLVFHCQAGKDRTGVLAALVLGCLGVERSAIVDDYVLTATRMDLILGRLRRDPQYADRFDELPPSVFVVEASTMEGFLDGLDERFGGARKWALGVGVTEAQLDLMDHLLVEDSG